MRTKPNNEGEPERIARAGLGGGQPRSRINIPPTVRGAVVFDRYPRPQRVVVKAYIARHNSTVKGRDSLRRHIRYLSREAVKLDRESGRFFDAKRQDLDATSETRSWANDRHHFRIILSPENGRSLDLKAYTREVMAKVERDLGQLNWFGVMHRNTDNPHVHLLIRGKGHDGKDLIIDRQYISNGIRMRAAEVATQWLGERTREEAEIAIAKEVNAERWTSLDGTLARFARPVEQGLQIDLKHAQLSRYALVNQELLAGRLDFLKHAGLAEQLVPPKRTFVGRRPVWLLKSDFQKQLNELGARNDVIKSLHATLGKEAAVVVSQIGRVRNDPGLSSSVRTAVLGVVVAKGAINELSDERFIVLQDYAGKLHYLRLWSSRQLDILRVGSIADFGRPADARRDVGREIIRVAEYAKDGHYSTARHLEWIRAQSPRPASGQVEKRLSAFASIVNKLAKQPDSGIVLSPKNAFSVDQVKLEQYIASRNRWLDVRVKAAHSLTEQIQAPAYTWLDRQILRTQLSKKIPATDLTHNAQVQTSINLRCDWLVNQGYARREGRDGIQKIEFVPGAISRLRAHEHEELARRCNDQQTKGLVYLREGQVVTGAYRATVFQHRGAFALIETANATFAAPVTRPPWAEIGQKVTAKAITARYARIERDATVTKSKSMGIER